jgi:hypothetical protein
VTTDSEAAGGCARSRQPDAVSAANAIVAEKKVRVRDLG